MPTFEYEGLQIEVDDEGYLLRYNDWNEKVACGLAEREGVSRECPLKTEQIEILKFIREYYEKFNSVPVVRAVCTNVHQPQQCEYLQFPDPVITCRIAGIPKLETGYTLM